MRRVAPERPVLHGIADVNPFIERECLEALFLLFGPVTLGRFHHADEMFFVIPADGQNAEFLDNAHGAHHVGTFVDDIAGLVNGIATAHKAELVDNRSEFVCATVNITDV